MSLSVLMVAEKPSICTAVAEALYQLTSNSKGPLHPRGRSPPVYEFPGTFQGKPALIKVTSVTGHVFSLDFPSNYQNWDAIDPFDLFAAPTLHVPEGKGGIMKHLEREARGMDKLVLWMDCDREGENICFEVIRIVHGVMNKASKGQHIFRAKFSAVTVKDIEKAMNNLVSPNENESKSVDARQELDLKVGVAFSRFQTRYFQGRYANLDSNIISFGPCQTPTLGFCVQRHDEIQSFVPEPFWSLDVSINLVNNKRLIVDWDRGRLFDRSVVDTFSHLVSGSDSLLCYQIETSESRKVRPQPLNTVELLKLASKHLGIGPHAAMRAAEHLYLSGYISYPRTESTAYPKSFDFREALAIQRDHNQWGDYCRNLLSKGYTSPRAGVDVGDHPPITPVAVAYDLSGDHWRIYELVTTHFLATISKDAVFSKTKAKFRAEKSGEEFTTSAKRLIDPGFLAICGDFQSTEEGDDDDDDESKDMPDLEQGWRYPIDNVVIRQGMTSAPGHLTESELIGLMEKHGIGTDASIPTHINNIMTRNYVTLGSGRTLIPTDLGIVLVHGYYRIDPDLVLPDVRAAIESFCDMIAKGTASKESVVKHSLANFQNKFLFFRDHINLMDNLFEASFSPLAQAGKPLGKCGKCLRFMRLITLQPQRLYCPTCEETYSLPQNGTIKLYKELKCPLDNFDLVLFSLGNTEKSQGKSYSLCPYCYNHPPSFSFKSTHAVAESKNPADNNADEEDGEEDEEEDELQERGHGHMGCNECLHPSCKHSLVQTGICQCPGTIVPKPVIKRAPKGGRGGGRGKGRGGRGGGRERPSESESEEDEEDEDQMKPCSGTMVLDVNSKPNWKLACNQCNTIIRFQAEIHQITPLPASAPNEGLCQECGVRQLRFEFNKLKPPPKLKGEDINYAGCVVCDDFLNDLSDIICGRSINVKIQRQLRQRRQLMAKKNGKKFGRRGPPGGKKNKESVLMSFSDF